MKQGLVLSLFVFSLLSIGLGSARPAGAASSCASLIGNCDYYLCREEAHPCGADGYFVGFSYRYCHEFESDEMSHVAPQTQEWFGRVSRCLQEDVEAIPVETSCSATELQAVAGHKDCYVSTGFCDIPLDDKLQVVTTVAREVIHPEIDQTFVQILQACDARK